MPNKSDILLSIIIPIFNREKTLTFAVDSVLNVTSDKIEVLLIDDGSTDKSGALCDGYALKDKRVKVIHKKNGGVSSARNIGIDNAQGKYIFFCDSDDQVYAEVLEKYIDGLSKSDCDLYIFDYVYHNLNDGKEVKQSFKMPAETELNKKAIVDNVIAPLILSAGTGLASSWHKFFLTEKIKNNNIRFEEKVFKGEDWRFVLDYADVAETAYYVSEALYRYNLDGTQTEKKYKKLAGYHLLGSPIRKLTLCEKYHLSDSQAVKAFIYKQIIDEIAFSVQSHCNRKELVKMKKNKYAQRALSFFKELKKQEYNNFEISRRYKLYAYSINTKMFAVLSMLYRGE